jgi:4a-hydroxytetrahydrobiopterin dehydratase
MAAWTKEEIDKHLADLDGWDNRGDRIARSFQFDDFVSAFGWMASVALIAERMGHHPDWSNVYNKVDVELSTHDAGGVTEKDIELARAMTELGTRSG